MSRYGVALHSCTSDQLLVLLNRGTPGSLIIDPDILSDTEMAELANYLGDLPRAVVLYTTLTPTAVTRTIELSRKAFVTVLFQTVDESPDVIAKAVLGVPQPALVGAFLALIRPQLASLPPSLRAAIEDSFSDGAGRHSPVTLARRVGLTRRSFDRWLVRAGIPSPRLLLAVPGVLRAIGLLRETNYSLRVVAAFAGFRSVRRLEVHSRSLVGVSAARLREPAIADRAVNRIAETVLAGRCLIYDDISFTKTGDSIDCDSP